MAKTQSTHSRFKDLCYTVGTKARVQTRIVNFSVTKRLWKRKAKWCSRSLIFSFATPTKKKLM